MWDHTVLPATRHKWTCPAITPANQAGTRFIYTGGMEGWVDLGSVVAALPEIVPTTAWPQVWCHNRYATKPSCSWVWMFKLSFQMHMLFCQWRVGCWQDWEHQEGDPVPCICCGVAQVSEANDGQRHRQHAGNSEALPEQSSAVTHCLLVSSLYVNVTLYVIVPLHTLHSYKFIGTYYMSSLLLSAEVFSVFLVLWLWANDCIFCNFTVIYSYIFTWELPMGGHVKYCPAVSTGDDKFSLSHKITLSVHYWYIVIRMSCVSHLHYLMLHSAHIVWRLDFYHV